MSSVVTTLERKKKDEADRVKAEDDQNKAEDERKAREQKMLAEKGLLKQVLIEAKIVEATEDFVRNIGVQWGFGNQQKISGGTYGLGVTGGSNTVVNKSIFTSLSLSNWQCTTRLLLEQVYLWPR